MMHKETEELLEMAKKIIRRDGDHSPMFFLKQGDGLAIVSMPFKDNDEKEMALEALKRIVIDSGCETYFQITSGWKVNATKSRERTMGRLKELKKAPSQEAFLKFLKEQMVETLPPSQSPYREEILLVVRYDKRTGSDGVSIPYYKDSNDEIVFGEPDELNGSMSSRWNVWYEHEYVFDDDKGKNGKKNSSPTK